MDKSSTVIQSKVVDGVLFELRENVFEGKTDWRIRVVDVGSGNNVGPIQIDPKRERAVASWERLVDHAEKMAFHAPAVDDDFVYYRKG